MTIAKLLENILSNFCYKEAIHTKGCSNHSPSKTPVLTGSADLVPKRSRRRWRERAAAANEISPKKSLRKNAVQFLTCHCSPFQPSQYLADIISWSQAWVEVKACCRSTAALQVIAAFSPSSFVSFERLHRFFSPRKGEASQPRTK